jgi:hypothetical protein
MYVYILIICVIFIKVKTLTMLTDYTSSREEIGQSKNLNYKSCSYKTILQTTTKDNLNTLLS